MNAQSKPTLAPALLARFSDIVGPKYAITDPQMQRSYLIELRGLYDGQTPVVLRPGSTDEVTAISNNDLDHQHGNCQPLAALGGVTVDAVVVGGIGGGALRKLANAGITYVSHGPDRSSFCHM